MQHLGIGPEPALVRAVDRDEHALRRVGGEPPPEVAELHEARTRPGSGASPARYMTLSLPSWSSASCDGEQRAERVAVRVLVRRDEEAIVRADRLGDGLEVSLSSVVVGGELIDQLGHAHAALDRRIVLEGELRGPLQPELAREPRLQHAVGGVEPGDASARACAPSRARSRRRAPWRRSGDVSTPVTVTKPIRGSFSSRSASESTWRSDSFTRRIRSVTDLTYPPPPRSRSSVSRASPRSLLAAVGRARSRPALPRATHRPAWRPLRGARPRSAPAGVQRRRRAHRGYAYLSSHRARELPGATACA